MLTVQNLKEFGANVEEGLQRCYGNEALYIRLCGTIPTEKKFDELAAAIEAKDLDTAFDTAHALKGVLGNLCLSPMYEKIITADHSGFSWKSDPYSYDPDHVN